MSITSSYEDWLVAENEAFCELDDAKNKVMSNMECLVLVQNLKNLIDLRMVDQNQTQTICTFTQRIIEDYLQDIEKINDSHKYLLNLGRIRRAYHK